MACYSLRSSSLYMHQGLAIENGLWFQRSKQVTRKCSQNEDELVRAKDRSRWVEQTNSQLKMLDVCGWTHILHPHDQGVYLNCPGARGTWWLENLVRLMNDKAVIISVWVNCGTSCGIRTHRWLTFSAMARRMVHAGSVVVEDSLHTNGGIWRSFSLVDEVNDCCYDWLQRQESCVNRRWSSNIMHWTANNWKQGQQSFVDYPSVDKAR